MTEEELSPGCSNNDLPPFECLPCPDPVTGSGNAKEVSMPETRDFMKETLAAIDEKNKQRAEDERIAGIVRDLGKRGQYVLNERPDGMSFEDYKIVRARLKKFKQHYIHGGTLVHKSAETEVRTNKNGRRVLIQSGKGTTYRKPFEIPEHIQKAIQSPAIDPLTQQLSK